MELKISTGLNGGGPDLTSNNPGGIIYMGDNYRANTLSGKYVLEQFNKGVWGPVQTTDKDGTTIATSVSTGVGSFHLGDYHSIGSGGQNVLFINHETDLAFYPGVWQAESIDGLTVVNPATRALEASRVVSQPNGTGRTGFPVPYQFTLAPTVNVAFYSVRIRLEEDSPEGITWVATSASGKEFMRKQDPTPRVASNYITVQFEYPVYLRVGDVANITVSHRHNGAIAQCTSGTTVPTEPWRETRSRRYIDVPLDRGTQSITIPFGIDNVTRYPLARPESRVLRISGTTPSIANKSLLVHAGVNLFENYLLIANISGTSTNESFSIEVDVPMAYRYIYFRKDFTDSVNSMNITMEAV
jgi:hypothetical protein